MPTFVLIGHCGPDSYLMKNAVSRAVPGATIVSADDQTDLDRHLAPGAVLLVNRVLGDGFESESGIELIRALHRRQPQAITMLVSNYPEAQQEAQAAGARPGFGKREVNSAQTKAILREAAGLAVA
jgi:hypothetical protein